MPLEWAKVDDYHIASTCGRYTVSRVNTGAHVHYIAWRRQPPLELGEVCLLSDCTHDERVDAIKRMRQACADHSESLAAR